MNEQLELDTYESPDSSVATRWESRVMSDVIDVNDYPSLEKGEVQTYIAMDDLEVNKRKISGKTKKEYKYSAPRFKNGDTLFPKMSRCLENGKTAFVDILDESEVAFGSTEFLVLRPSSDAQILPKFIYYTMRRPEIVASAYKWRNGTTARRQRIPIEYFDNTEIPVPPIRVQNRIVSILDSIDTKIETNDTIHRLQNKLLKSKFSSWFNVHVDEDDALEGDLSRLRDIAKLKRETVDPSEEPETEWELYSFEAYDQRQYPFLEYGSEIGSAKYKLEQDCILLSKLNPRIKRIWKPERITEKSICSSEFLVVAPRKRSYTGFLWGLLNSDQFIEYMKSHTTGTSNSHQRVKPDDVLDYQYKTPDRSAIVRFQEYSEFIQQYNYSVKRQNRLLEQFRDIMLPSLMSETPSLEILAPEGLEIVE